MKVFVLHHVHQIAPEQEDVKLIGIYSTHERAKAAQYRMSQLPGFRDAIDGFTIDEYEVDSDHWTEGYTTFVAYVGPEELHDATMLHFVQEDNHVTVYLQSCEGHSFALEFLDVTNIHAIHPEGMMLYALAEMEAKPPLRHFVFVNWDEENDATLEILARDLRVIEVKK